MSGPVAPSGPFTEALKAWKVRIVDWLGLDPGEVVDVEWRSTGALPSPVTLQMVSGAKSSLVRGLWDGFHHYSGDGLVVSHVRLTMDEYRDLREHAGPMPDYLAMAREQRRAELRERFLTVLGEHPPSYVTDLGMATWDGCECDPTVAQGDWPGHVADLLVAEVDR